MQDLFLDYQSYNKEYNYNKNLYDNMLLYNSEILERMYNNLIEKSLGVDSFCIDYMDFSEYINLVSTEHVIICRKFLDEVRTLKDKYERAFNLKEAIMKRIKLYSRVSFVDLIELLQIYNLDFDIAGNIINVYVGENEYPIIIFDYFDLVSDEGYISLLLQHLLGEEVCNFVRFYINFQNLIKSRCGIREAYSVYKKTCIIR